MAQYQSFNQHRFVFSELFIDEISGKTSHLKTWNNIACFCATWAFLYILYTGKMNLDYLIWYVGLVGFQNLVGKFMSLKMGIPAPASPALPDTPAPVGLPDPELHPKT